MPQFTNRPPEQTKSHGFRLIRTPAAAPFRAYVLSDNLIGCPTHFVGNRTIPCERPYCEPCENGVAWRWHGYLLIQIQATSEVAIFETTATAAEIFAQYYERHRTLRGCYFQAERVNKRPNGRVLIQTKPADLAQIKLQPAMDVARLLAHIWNIAPNQTEKTPSTPRPPFHNLRTDRTRPEIAPAADTFKAAVAVIPTSQEGKGNGKKHPPDTDS